MIKIPQLKDSPVDIQRLQNYLNKTSGYELSQLHNPCYKPVMIKYMKDLKNLTGLEESQLNVFFNSIIEEKYRKAFKMLKSDITMILFVAILYYSRQKKYNLVESLYILLAIRLYANRVNQFWRYCKEDIWDLAFKDLSQKHLYKVKNGISNTILYIATHEFNKNKELLTSTKITEKSAIDMIYMLRHRVNQSVRSFGERYYEIANGEGNPNEAKEKTQQNINVGLIANQISERMCTYSQIDVRAFNEAVSRSRIRRDLALPIIQGLSRHEYKENIYFLILLMSKVIELSTICVKHQTLIKSIVSDRVKINHYSIKKEMLDLIDSLMLQTKSMNKDQLTLLLSTYIVFKIKTLIC